MPRRRVKTRHSKHIDRARSLYVVTRKLSQSNHRILFRMDHHPGPNMSTDDRLEYGKRAMHLFQRKFGPPMLWPHDVQSAIRHFTSVASYHHGVEECHRALCVYF